MRLFLEEKKNHKLFNMQEIDSVGDFLHILCTAATTLMWAFTKQEQVDELQSSVHMIVLTYSDIKKKKILQEGPTKVYV